MKPGCHRSEYVENGAVMRAELLQLVQPLEWGQQQSINGAPSKANEKAEVFPPASSFAATSEELPMLGWLKTALNQALNNHNNSKELPIPSYLPLLQPSLLFSSLSW